MRSVYFAAVFACCLLARASSQFLEGKFNLRNEWTNQFGGEIRIELNKTYPFGWLFYVSFDVPVENFVIDQTIQIGEHPDLTKYAFKNEWYNEVLHNPASGVRNFQCRGTTPKVPKIDARLIPLAYREENYRVALNRALLGITEPPDLRPTTTTTPIPKTTVTTMATTLGAWWTMLSSATTRPTTTIPTIEPITVTTTTLPNLAELNLRYNLRQVITKSLLFFEAQRSGLLPTNNRIPWRSHSALRDGIDVKLDLSGGYYVDGGYVKYGFPMAFSITQMAWSLLEFRNAYLASYQIPEVMNALKWGTDYFIKCHPSKYVFYGQVFTSDSDDKFWGRPEDYKETRYSYKITKSKPGSDLAAETAAALAATSIVFNETNATYSKILLKHAVELYDFADKYRGSYHDSIVNAKKLYRSWSGFWDELAWGAIWLYKATGKKIYLEIAESRFVKNPFKEKMKVFSWDDKRIGVAYLLTQATKLDKYKYQVTDFCNYMLPGGGATYTPKGLLFLNEWGPNRHAANAGFICLLVANLGIRSGVYRRMANGQLSYILGDGGMSYVVGFGKNYPKKIHHRASSCPDRPQSCSWEAKESKLPNPQLLNGAMVAGPDKWDGFYDDRGDYKRNVVALDFNAALQSLAAGILELQVTGQTFSEPNPQELQSAIAKNYAVGHNYNEVLHKSLLFYEAQRSGKLPKDNRIPWRVSAFLNDTGDRGEDLTGGYFDAGDYVKFNFPMAFTVTVLSWGMIQYREAYVSAGEWENAKDAIKWATDYFIKCHVGKDEFYGQVGSGRLDHSYWTTPDQMTSVKRPAYKLTRKSPGSELVAEVAAAMAAASIVFRDSDPGYAATLLRHARELRDFATKYREKYHTSIPDAASFYKSFSGFKDELAWASTWLYLATNQTRYLMQAQAQYRQIPLPHKSSAGFHWDWKTAGVQLLLAQITGGQNYRRALKSFCDGLFPGKGITYTPRGLIHLDQWGPLRHAAGVSWICLGAANLGIETAKYREFAKRQIHYMLGDSGYGSYVVGYGPNPPTRPHHRGSSCPNPPPICTHAQLDTQQSNPHVLYGALIGGPDKQDRFNDDRKNFKTNEVALDYNAAFQSCIAALKFLEMHPPPTTTPDPALVTTAQSTTTTLNKDDVTVRMPPAFGQYLEDWDNYDDVDVNATSPANDVNVTSAALSRSSGGLENATTARVGVDADMIAYAKQCKMQGLFYVFNYCYQALNENLEKNVTAKENIPCRWQAYYRCVSAEVGNCSRVWTAWELWNLEGETPYFGENETACGESSTETPQNTTGALEATTTVEDTPVATTSTDLETSPTTIAPSTTKSALPSSTVSKVTRIIYVGTTTKRVPRPNTCSPKKLFDLCAIPRTEFPTHAISKTLKCRFTALKKCVDYNGAKCTGVWNLWGEWNNVLAGDEQYFTEDELRCRERKDEAIAQCQPSGITDSMASCFNSPQVQNAHLYHTPNVKPACRQEAVFRVCVNKIVGHCDSTWSLFKYWNLKKKDGSLKIVTPPECKGAAPPPSGKYMSVCVALLWLIKYTLVT